MSEKCLELGVMNFFGKIDSGYAVAVENANKEYASTFEGRINAIFKKCIYFWSSRKLRRFLEVLCFVGRNCSHVYVCASPIHLSPKHVNNREKCHECNAYMLAQLSMNYFLNHIFSER